ncbi:MAG TPA: hypothetical protein VG146_13560 [Verrucomicrobiae bacterium]|nr:hypothetical protein [Verrucomicrobiae bacterium]
MKKISLYVLLLSGGIIGSIAQPFPPDFYFPVFSAGLLRTDINPALLYYQAFLAAPEPLSNADSDFLYSREGRAGKLPEKFDAIFAGYDPQFSLVRQAAACTVPCDWGIDISRGPATLLPGLARCKAVAVATKFRVMWELQHDRQSDARDDLLAAFAVARNASRDGTLISVLVQIASEAIDCTTIAENFGRFSPETFKELAEGLDAGPVRGTLAGSIPTEKAMFHDWLVNRILFLQKANPGDDAKVMEQIHKDLAPVEFNEGGKTDIWGPLARAAGGTSQGLLTLLSDEGQLYDRLAEILTLPPATYQQQAKQFRAQLEASSNPLLSGAFPGPAFERAKQREFNIQVWLAMVRAAAEYKVNGMPGLQTVNDPFGQGPFQFQRFVFEGVDRGFSLKSAYSGSGFPEMLIFVETTGPGFHVDGPKAGESLPLTGAAK